MVRIGDKTGRDNSFEGGGGGVNHISNVATSS